MESEKKSIEIIPGFRRSSQLLLIKNENQLFRKKNVYNNVTRYQCYFSECRVSVSVDADGTCCQLSNNEHHKHPPPVDLINKLKVINQVKKDCANSGLKQEGIRDIFDKHCCKNKDLAVSLSFPKMRRNLIKIRNAGLGKNSTSPRELINVFANDIQQEKNIDQFKKLESEKKLIEIIPGFRRSSELLLIKNENQLFRKKNVYNNVTRYQCYFSECKVSVSVDADGDCYQLSNNEQHEHLAPVDLINKLKVINQVKKDCANSGLKRKGIRDIFDKQCFQNKEHGVSLSFPKMRRNLIKIRNAGLPKNPTSPQELMNVFSDDHFLQVYGYSKYEESRFYIDTIIEENFAYCVFASPTICELLKTYEGSRHFLIDETFNRVPMCGFSQFLIIHLQYLDQTVPFLYILMTERSKVAYMHVLQFIDKNVCEFQTSTFLTDYKNALRSSLKTVFPNANLKGCWLHYCQALRRKAHKIPKFTSTLRSNKACQRWYQKFLALPLISPRQIQEMLLNLKNDLQEFSDVQQEVLSLFVEYYERQWMGKISPAEFIVSNEEVRTTSPLEGFNSHLAKKLEKHGRFFRFLEVIREEDFKASMNLKNVFDGALHTLPVKRRRHQNQATKIEAMVKNLNTNKISLTDFFNQLADSDNKFLEWSEMEGIIESADESDGEEFADTHIQSHQMTNVSIKQEMFY